jgi:hypothetical protein
MLFWGGIIAAVLVLQLLAWPRTPVQVAETFRGSDAGAECLEPDLSAVLGEEDALASDEQDVVPDEGELAEFERFFREQGYEGLGSESDFYGLPSLIEENERLLRELGGGDAGSAQGPSEILPNDGLSEEGIKQTLRELERERMQMQQPGC